MRSGPTPTHYETLGVSADATAEQIKIAYRTQIRQVHPDVAGPTGADRAAELSAAYAVLSRPDERSRYDASLAAGAADTFGPATGGGSDFTDDRDFTDDWGTLGEWEDAGSAGGADQPGDAGRPVAEDEPLDDVLVEEDTDGTASGDPGAPARFDWVGIGYDETHYRSPGRRRLLTVAIGLALLIGAGLWAWLSWSDGGIISRTETGVVAVVVAVLGLLIGFGLHHRMPADPRLTAGGAVALIIVGEVAGRPPWQSPIRLLYVLALALTVGLLLRQWWAEHRRLSAVLPMKALRENNLFGSLSGDVASDLLHRDCDPLYAIPGVRIIRTPEPDALFTHVLVCGTKVAYVRAVVADGGHFRWSGPTLFRDRADGWPVEVIKGPYEDAARRLPAVFGKKTEVRCWLLIYPPDRAAVSQQPDPLMPAVVSPADGIDAIGRFLTTDNDAALVDQVRVVAAADSLYG